MCDSDSYQSPIHLYTRADDRFEAYEEELESPSAANDTMLGILNGHHDSFTSDFRDLRRG